MFLVKDDEVVKLLELRFKLCAVGVEADGTDVEKGGGVWFGLDGSVDNEMTMKAKMYFMITYGGKKFC